MNHTAPAAVHGPVSGPLNCPALHSQEHESMIHASHHRSVTYGLSQSDVPDFSAMAMGVVHAALEENRFLYQHAAPVMETLFQQIANTQSMVLLTARSGMVLHSLGDNDFLEKAARVALQPGVDWSEKCKGTNAIGTALAEERPVVVHGSQHYLHANRFLTCSCTPIFDPYGKVMGALDVSGDYRSYHQHTMALARMSAQMIENHMYADVFPNDVIVRFHTRPEFLGTLMQGIAVFSGDGRFITANRSAQFQLGLSVSALAAHTFSSLFGLAFSQFHDRLRTALGQPVALLLHSGVTVCAVSDRNQRQQTFHLVPEAAGAVPKTVQPVAAAVAPVGNPASRRGEAFSSLRYLDTGDAQVASVIQKLGRIRGQDIPVMILGETGTGKDLLAQAMHNDSPRARANFVSVNCASIPETLIESELFGYEDGAFTGARRKGSMGKVQCAHGGTLFLDEIGDMPRHLQARLLRVLQERKVSPLGSGKEIEVDVAVICATNKNLKEMIARGEFREDLYYRLNGLVVRLPALRERTDLDVITRKILASVSHTAKPPEIAPAVMQLFRRYAWPGNFRQLHNLLRTAVVMAGEEGTVSLEHLPDDFMEEVRDAHLLHDTPQCPASPSPVAAAPVTAFPIAASLPLTTPPVQAPTTPPVPHTCTTAAPQPPRSHPVDQTGNLARLENVALDAMAQALRATQGNVSVAAKMLGVSRNTIYRKKEQLPEDVWR